MTAVHTLYLSVCVCVCVCGCTSTLRPDDHDDPLPPNETQTHQLLSGTYQQIHLKKPETEMRSLMRLNGDKLTRIIFIHTLHQHKLLWLPSFTGLCVCVCVCVCTCTLGPDDHDDPLPLNETQTHQLLSGTYQTVKLKETRNRDEIINEAQLRQTQTRMIFIHTLYQHI